jgi:hypothetical protein
MAWPAGGWSGPHPAASTATAAVPRRASHALAAVDRVTADRAIVDRAPVDRAVGRAPVDHAVVDRGAPERWVLFIW